MTNSSGEKNQEKIPLIIDTDMSPDSWVAVLFAALHPNADLLAVSVSGTGEAHGPAGARNAQRLVSLAGKGDIPVAFGRPHPFKGREHFPNLMRFVIDHMFWKKPPRVDPAPALSDSVALISKLLRESKQKVTFAAVGPQTNLAAVITQYPQLTDKIKAIYMMGGALNVPGNIKEIAMWKSNTTAEWNFFCDPLGAKTVLGSGVPIFLVPLDATNQIPVTGDFLARLSEQVESPAGKFVLDMLTLLVVKLRAGTNFYLWDPITTACALDPAVGSFEKRRVDVVTQFGQEWGRILDSEKGTPIFSASVLDREKFEQTIIHTLS
jgi:inosine-uridine nucleoside N-ribohydrolase